MIRLRSLSGVVDHRHPLWPAVRQGLAHPRFRRSIPVEIVPGHYKCGSASEQRTVAVAEQLGSANPRIKVFEPRMEEVQRLYGLYGLLLWLEEVVRHELLHIVLKDRDHKSEHWHTVGEVGVDPDPEGRTEHLTRIRTVEKFYGSLGTKVPYDDDRLDAIHAETLAYRGRTRAGSAGDS